MRGAVGGKKRTRARLLNGCSTTEWRDPHEIRVRADLHGKLSINTVKTYLREMVKRHMIERRLSFYPDSSNGHHYYVYRKPDEAG